MKKDPAKPISAWLSIICAGRVSVVAWLSMKAPAAISASAIRWNRGTRSGFMKGMRASPPRIVAAEITANSGTSWPWVMPSTWNMRGAPAPCSDSTSRNSSSVTVRCSMAGLASQRMSRSGALRCSSITTASVSATTDSASTQPSQGASVHQRIGPMTKPTVMPAKPSAISSQLTRSRGAMDLTRGGDFSGRQ